MADGEELPANDRWLRVLTRSSYIKKSDGTLHQNALKGKGPKPFAPGIPPRDWQHELSGRQRSLCTNLEAECTAFVERLCDRLAAQGTLPKDLAFSGIAYAEVPVLRGPLIPNRVTCNTIHTPKPQGDPDEDPAHADFVTYGSTDDDLDEVRTWLQSRLIVLKPDQLAQLDGPVPPQITPGGIAVLSSAGVGNYQITSFDEAPDRDPE